MKPGGTNEPAVPLTINDEVAESEEEAGEDGIEDGQEEGEHSESLVGSGLSTLIGVL